MGKGSAKCKKQSLERSTPAIFRGGGVGVYKIWAPMRCGKTWDFMGMCMGYEKKSARSDKKIQKVLGRIRRICNYPGNLPARSSMAETTVTPTCWGHSFEWRLKDTLYNLSAAVWRALSGENPVCHGPGLVLGLRLTLEMLPYYLVVA